jgi:hypothetical protein
MAVDTAVVAGVEAGDVPEGSPPRQAGEDRGTPRPGSTRRDGGQEAAPEHAGGPGSTERRDETGEGRGAAVREQGAEPS